MPKVTTQSVIATPSYNTAGAFSIIAETRHIDLVADGSKDKDIEEMDVHVQPIVEPDFDLDW